jgi:hypothetical protein
MSFGWSALIRTTASYAAAYGPPLPASMPAASTAFAANCARWSSGQVSSWVSASATPRGVGLARRPATSSLSSGSPSPSIASAAWSAGRSPASASKGVRAQRISGLGQSST